jgi:capsular polysaccharide transport system ATP-binding protein
MIKIPINQVIDERLCDVFFGLGWHPFGHPAIGQPVYMAEHIGVSVRLRCPASATGIWFLRHGWSGAVRVSYGDASIEAYLHTSDQDLNFVVPMPVPVSDDKDVIIRIVSREGQSPLHNQVWLLGIVFSEMPSHRPDIPAGQERSPSRNGCIRLRNVCKYYPTQSGRKVVLDDLTVEFRPGEHVGVLGRNGTGKSTLIRIMGGAEAPSAGEVQRQGSISWPLGFGGGFQPGMSGRDNIRFVTRIYDRDWKDVFAYVEDFAELGSYMDMPVRTYSAGMQARLAVGMSLALQFDYYLIDELPGVGDARFSDKFYSIMQERMRVSTLILVSHYQESIRGMCKIGAVLNNGRLTRFEDIDAAIDEYRSL